jgi:hypothetical protein
VAPRDHLGLPLRWEFVPVVQSNYGTIWWTWRAYEHSGNLTMQAKDTFETLTECVENARSHGYKPSAIS